MNGKDEGRAWLELSEGKPQDTLTGKDAKCFRIAVYKVKAEEIGSVVEEKRSCFVEENNKRVEIECGSR